MGGQGEEVAGLRDGEGAEKGAKSREDDILEVRRRASVGAFERRGEEARDSGQDCERSAAAIGAEIAARRTNFGKEEDQACGGRGWHFALHGVELRWSRWSRWKLGGLRV